MADIANVLTVADRMLELMASAATTESAMSWGVANEFQTLEKIISDIKAVLIDAERLQGAMDDRMKGLLWRVEHSVYEADDVLDGFFAVALGPRFMSQNKIATKVRSFFSLTPSNPLVFRIKTIYETKKVRTALDEALSSAKELHELQKTRQETRPIFVREEDVVGRDFDKGEIMKLVLEAAHTKTESDQKLRVVSVVGVEGIGKTTLAQLVYSDAEIKKSFDLRMWVCISDLADTRLIVQKLIESAKDEKVQCDYLQKDRLQEQLRKTINRKSFFLVLDNVRDENRANWMCLRNLLTGHAKGSTVLVTTRSKKVAKITRTVAQSYHLGPLKEADALFLLETMALGISEDQNSVQAFKEIGRQIAGKCKGVPLVIQNVGSSMAHKSVAEWQSFLHKEKIAEVMREISFANNDDQGTKVVTGMREPTHSLVPEEEVIGRDADKEAILKQLLEHNSEETELTVIAIVGIAGLGKTALAQLIFNDFQVQDHFDLRLWVSVTDVFDLKIIMEKILVSLTTTDPGQLRVEELESLIRQEILGNRCLLILDDVWNEESEKLSHLKSLLFLGASGSRIIVTTRSEGVASATAGEKHTHKLKALDEGSSWTLFVKVAFEKRQRLTNFKIKKIGKKIVANCGGIPLAIRTIGRILYYKNAETEWQSFYEEELAKTLNGADKLVSLKLSYDQLPSFLKPCFAYCGLFPKDYDIDVKTLINLWMSQGFIRKDSDLSVEAVGYQYFVELLRRSFLQETMRDELGYITKCKMQNFMCTDLAKSVAQDVCATLSWQGGINSTNPRHVALDFHLDSSWHIRSLAQSKTIRSLILPRQLRREVEGRSSESVCNEIKKCKYLRVLDLHNSGIKVVADTIGDLKFLRYLDLSQNLSIKALPNSIGRLWNLQSLKLNHCSNLQKLPKAIKNLVNLRNLENDSCYGLISMPRGLGKLTNLQTLSEFVLSNGTGSVSGKCGKLNELEELNELRGKLKIKNLRCLGGDDSTRAKLNEKRHLVSLVLMWDFDAAITESDCENLLKDLQPHQDLRELSLSAYGGVRFSNWLPELGNLVKFSLSRCTKCQCLPPIDHLPHLEVLLIDELPELEYISEDKSGPFFQSLKELRLRNLPKLARWWKHEVEGRTFPRFSKLIIKDCPNLKSMPLFPCLEERLVLKNTRWEPFLETIASVTSSTNVTPVVSLSKLRSLCFTNMSKGDPKVWQSLASLRSLTFDHLKDIETFLEGLEQLTNLQELHIWRCALKEISWIRNIKSLRILSLKLCPDLTIPRDQISLITSLQKVEIEECPKISHIERMLKDHLYNLEITNSKSTAFSG